MAKSEGLRLREVRAAFRLIGECVELGADPHFWSPHLFEGLCKLAGAVGAHGGETEGLFTIDPNVRFWSIYVVGCRKSDLTTFPHYMAQEAYRTIDQPIKNCATIVRGGAPLATRSHEQLIGELDWRRSEVFNDYFRVDRIDDRMLCYCRVPNERRAGVDLWHSVGMYRGLGDRPFTARERRMVRLVYQELRPLLGTRLAICGRRAVRPLSPRLQETLDHLLGGYSEKQIAEKFRLAKSTVNEYVGTLYKRYNVSSRAELMAMFLRWRGTRSEEAQERQLSDSDTPAIEGHDDDQQ